MYKPTYALTNKSNWSIMHAQLQLINNVWTLTHKLNNALTQFTHTCKSPQNFHPNQLTQMIVLITNSSKEKKSRNREGEERVLRTEAPPLRRERLEQESRNISRQELAETREWDLKWRAETRRRRIPRKKTEIRRSVTSQGRESKPR